MGYLEPMQKMSGPRVYLRELEGRDVNERYLSWFQDAELIRFYSGSRKKFSKETILEDIETGARSGSHRVYGIFSNENDLCIGNVKIGPIIKEQKIADLSTIIGDRNYLGKGLASEAVGLGIQIAFDWFDLRKLFTGMYESNAASIKAYVKAGWIVEGRLKGHYWVDGKPMDRILAGCFNPKYFSADEINDVQSKSGNYL